MLLVDQRQLLNCYPNSGIQSVKYPLSLVLTLLNLEVEHKKSTFLFYRRHAGLQTYSGFTHGDLQP